MFNTIVGVVPLKDFCVRIDYSDGISGVVDFTSVIQRGGVFAPLADPNQFAQVKIGERGRWLEWPGEIDFCADALRIAIENAPQAEIHAAVAE